MLQIGTKAPDFSLKDQDGNLHSINSYKGNWILVFFYPKDDTLFCIKEACSLRDNYSELKSRNVKVLGINQDDKDSHKSFKEKYNLPYILLSDEDKEVAKLYQAKGLLFTKRISYLINPEGNIEYAFPIVNSFSHGKDVLKVIEKSNN